MEKGEREEEMSFSNWARSIMEHLHLLKKETGLDLEPVHPDDPDYKDAPYEMHYAFDEKFSESMPSGIRFRLKTK